MNFQRALLSQILFFVSVLSIAVSEVACPWTNSAALQFSSGHIETSGNGLQLALNIAGGVSAEIPGMVRMEDWEDSLFLVLNEYHGEGVIRARNAEGTHAQVKVKQRHIFLEELEPAVDGGLKEVTGDRLLTVYHRLLEELKVQGDDYGRRILLQADTQLATLRANGDMEIHLYRYRNGALTLTGMLIADNRFRYELKLLTTVRYDTPSASEFQIFSISETFDYEATQPVKWSDKGGLGIVSQVIVGQILKGLPVVTGIEASGFGKWALAGFSRYDFPNKFPRCNKII